jgi:hypothetical protein
MAFVEPGQLILIDGRRNGWSRPVALPEDVDDPSVEKADGVVTLPQHVFWTRADKSWDLGDRGQRLQVYEIVLTEGTDEDVRRYIKVDDLIDLWDELWLPDHVRRAWARHLGQLRGVDLEC